MVAMGRPFPQTSIVGAAMFRFEPRETTRSRRARGCYKAHVTRNPSDDTAEIQAAHVNAAQVQADLRRRWIYLMPVVFVTYSLAYLGRSNFGFGAAAGLAQSLHITESRAAFLAAAFFLGYFLFQVPAATYA